MQYLPAEKINGFHNYHKTSVVNIAETFSLSEYTEIDVGSVELLPRNSLKELTQRLLAARFQWGRFGGGREWGREGLGDGQRRKEMGGDAGWEKAKMGRGE